MKSQHMIIIITTIRDQYEACVRIVFNRKMLWRIKVPIYKVHVGSEHNCSLTDSTVITTAKGFLFFTREDVNRTTVSL